jgi:hypothetical protein
MQRIKTLTKQMIASLPGPVALRAMDALMLTLHANTRAFHKKQKTIYEKIGRPDRIASGPFQGMRYISRASSSCLLPKLLGTYEMEINSAVETICQAKCDVVVDIGSAEGYYAVGLARRMPNARIVCFDIYKPARYLLNQLANKNNVAPRIEQRSLCTPQNLQDVLQTAVNPAVLCDCEGAEDHLLLPDETPDLTRAIVLVELHERIRPGVTERLRKRFCVSHKIEVMAGHDRALSLIPEQLRGRLTDQEARFALDEDRYGPMEWFFMTPMTARPPATTVQKASGSRAMAG